MDFLDRYTSVIVAEESHDKYGRTVPLHYHIYIKASLDEDTIRKDVQKHLNIPKMGRGKTNKYYCLKKWNEDIAYFCKQKNIKKTKGFTDAEIQNAIVEGEKKYSKKYLIEEKTDNSNLNCVKKETLTEWKKILENAMHYHFQEKPDKNQIISIDKWKKLIIHWALKELRPIPHPANLKRYALSIDLLAQSDFGDNPEKLEEEIEKLDLLD